MVTCVNQQNVLILLSQISLQSSDDVVAQNAVDVGMDVVGVQDGDVALGLGSLSGSLGLGGGGGAGGSGLDGLAAAGNQTQNHHQRQQHCDNFAHWKIPPFSLQKASVRG